MDGTTLSKAAKIIIKVGEQIEEMNEILGERLIEALTGEMRVVYSSDYSKDSKGGWMIMHYLWNIALYKGTRKKNPDAHIAVKTVLYHEHDSNIQGWVPSIYVMYSPDKSPFDLNDTFWIFDTLNKENEYRLEEDHRLWHWETNKKNDSWAFCIPLVKMNNEKDLINQIVEPVKNLIKQTANAFPERCDAFHFIQEDNGLRILDENHK